MERRKRKVKLSIGHYSKGEEHPFASLWYTHFEQDGRTWSVMQRCAVTPLCEVKLGVAALGLNESHTYYVFDFWEQVGSVVKDSVLPLPALSLGETAVYGVFDVTDGKPRLVGSDRHISMDVVSVRSARPMGNGLELAVSGFPGLTCRYTVYAPEAQGIVHAEGGSASCHTQGDIHVIEARFSDDTLQLLLE